MAVQVSKPRDGWGAVRWDGMGERESAIRII